MARNDHEVRAAAQGAAEAGYVGTDAPADRSDSGTVPRELTDEDRAKIAELDAAREKFESQKRWSDLIRTILAKAELVGTAEEKVTLFAEAGHLFISRSSNQAEAIRCFERVLEFDGRHSDAISQLKQIYEKRRDWERLIRTMQREVELLDVKDRPERYADMAKLATERLRKPEICIELWELVLASDPENHEALSSLVGLHERARNWQALAGLLEKLAAQTTDLTELNALFQKLGLIYADKLSDDEGAVRVFRQVLSLDPEDRRAQEQLKRRYVSLKAWDDLEEFYAPSEKWDELIRIFEREAENKEAPNEERVELLFRAARIWEQRKDKSDRAAREYEKVLEIDPDNLKAAEALSPIYEAGKDPKKLVSLYEVRLKDKSASTEARLHLVRQAGLIYEERLRDAASAFEKYLEAFALDPTRDEAYQDLSRLAPSVGGWARLAEAYEAAIDNAANEDAAMELRIQFGRVLSQMEKWEDAITQYATVYKARPDDLSAVAALGELYRKTGRYQELLDVYAKHAELEQDPERRRALAYDMASLWETELNQPDRAVAAYLEIVNEYGGEETNAFRALDRLYEAQEQWTELAEILEKRIDLGPESREELAALKFRLGRLFEQRLKQKSRAVETYREVLTLMPDHEGAREALEALQSDKEVFVEAARILEPVYEGQAEWSKLIEALRVQLRGAKEPSERLALLSKIGDVYAERLEDPVKSFEAFSDAFRAAPDHENTLARLELIASEQDKYGELVKLLTEVAEKTQDPRLAKSMWLKVAHLQETQLEAVNGAVQAYRKVLDHDPDDGEVLSALESLFRRAERWKDLLGVLRRREELVSDTERKVEILSQMALIHDERLNEPAEAITIFREILHVYPTHGSALAALDRIFEREGMWSDLADNVDRQLSMSSDPREQVRFMLRLADLREARMGAVEAAIEMYREVLDRDPNNETALNALERLGQNPKYELLVAEILEPVYRNADEFEKLIGVCETQAKHAEAAERRVELLHRIAELYLVALDSQSSAFRTYARALAEDPGNASTYDQLDRLTRVIGNDRELAEVYEGRAKALADSTIAATLFAKAARIRESELGDHDAAVQHYQRVLELDSHNVDAANALERLFQVSGRYEELAEVYSTKARRLGSPEEQIECLFRAADIQERILENSEKAVEVYRRVLDVDPEDIRAMDKLIELNIRLERWDQLLEIYSRKVDVVSDPEEKKRIYVEVGAVYEREKGDPARAIDAYQKILEFDPDDVVAISRLDSLYQASGNWQELLSVLEREADLATDPSEITSYRYRTAELWHQKLGDASRAVEIYADILRISPDHVPTLQALEQLVRDGTEAIAAASVIEPIYKQFGEWDKLVWAKEVRARHERDVVKKLELLHEIAELYEFKLGQARKAFDAYAEALPLDSTDEKTPSSLERLADSLGAWGEVARLYDDQLRKLREEDTSDAAVLLALRTAMIYEVQLGDVPSAIDRYRMVIDTDATHAQALEALDRLYEASERWSDLADVLRKTMAVASSPEEILDTQFRLGQLYQNNLGDVSQAIDQYREILSAAPEDLRTVSALELLFAEGVEPLAIGEILEPLYRLQSAWDKLIRLEEVGLRYQGEVSDRIQKMHHLAEAYEERLNDHQKAFEWMQRALLEDSAHDHTLSECERLAKIVDGWSQLANTYADAIQTAKDKQARVALGLRLARVYETELNDLQNAEATYRFVLGNDSREAESLQALDRIYEGYGAHAALSQVLRMRIAATHNVADLVELNHRLGQVLYRDLRQHDEATRVFRHVVEELDRGHIESIRALEDIYTNQGEWSQLFAVFEKELSVAGGDSAQSEILARMARIAADKLGDKNKAVELWRKVLDLRGEDAEALGALGDIYASQENWRDLVDVLEREVAISDQDDVRVRIYSDLGRIWFTKLGRDRNALENWERVLDIDPANTNALFHIASIYQAGKQTHELVDTLTRIIEVGAGTLEDQQLENVYSQLGKLYSEELKQPADAVDAYRHVLELNYRNVEVLDALERIHREEAQWEDVVSVKQRRVNALQDAEEKVRVLTEMAQVWDEQVGESDRGTDAYQQILEIDPMHEVAFARLKGLHKEAGRWEQLIDMYLARVEVTESLEQRVELLRGVAHIYEHELSEPEKAFDALQVAWSQDYQNAETARELERLAGATQKWNELLAGANQALQEIQDPPTKIAICLHCARWYGQELGRPEYAIYCYQQILALDPVNVPAMRQMADLYRTTQQWQTLSQILGRIIEMTSDPREKADSYVQIGQLCVEHLGVPQQAEGYYRQALELDPNNLGALEAMERILRERSNWNALVPVLVAKTEALSDDNERWVQAKLAVAEVLEDYLRDTSGAIQSYRSVLERDDRNLEALKGLERLYSQSENWVDLMPVLEAQFEVVRTERERIAILMRLASMWEEEFRKPEKAAERLEQVLDVDPTHDGALTALERLYRQTKRWDDVVATYERHIGITADRAQKVQLFKALGDTFENDVNDQDRAVDAYLSVLGIQEDDIDALDRLARLYDKRGDHSSALEMMQQLSKRAQDLEQQVDLQYRMGRILDEHLGDRTAALEHFRNALDINSSHLPSLEAMRRIHIDGGDWLAAARLLDQEAQVQQSPRVVSRLLYELGMIYRDRLDDYDQAIEAFQASHKRDPDNEDSALPLAEEYFKREQFDAAFPLLEMLVRGSGKRPTEEQHHLSYMLGETATKLGYDEEAVKAFTKANQLDNNHLPSLMGLAGAYYRTKDWEKAFKFYQVLLIHHRDALGRADTTEIFFRLGVIKREQGERRKALNMFDKALEEDSSHRPTLEAVIALYEEQNSWEQAIHFKKQLLPVVNDNEQVSLLESIGDLWKEKVKNIQKAIESYSDAVDLRPEDHRLLHKLLLAYQETKQWERGVDVIKRIRDLEERPAARAKYSYTIGVILRDELKDPEASLQVMEEALDQDPEMLRAFEAINKILTQRKDWKQLERTFRKMLHRIVGKGNADLEFSLWHNLGVIYRDRLNNFESAAEAFRMASKVKPEDETEHRILAELFGRLSGRLDDAIEEYQWLLRNDPSRMESYRELYRLYFNARAYDKAWCVASALVFLKFADGDQEQFFNQYRQQGVIRPQSRVDNERWVKHLFHRDEDLFVGKIFEAISPAVLALKSASDRSLHLHKKYEVDPTTSTVTFARTYGFVSQVLNLQLIPRLFLRSDAQGGLTHVPGSSPPAVVCGASLLSGFRPQDLAFVLGRHLSYYRGEHYLRTVFASVAELKTMLLAGLRVAGLMPAADPSIEQTAQQLAAKLAPAHLEALRTVGKKFMDAGARVDLKQWMQSVELTGCRAGFLVCNDLETAARMIQALPPEGTTDLPPKDKIMETVLFSVSEDYFALREALGIQIQV